MNGILGVLRSIQGFLDFGDTCSKCYVLRMLFQIFSGIWDNEEHLQYIVNQTYNATCKWLDFCMNMWCRTTYLRGIAQLLTKNLCCTVTSLQHGLLCSNLIGQNSFFGPRCLPRS